jgi:hypothetical protein
LPCIVELHEVGWTLTLVHYVLYIVKHYLACFGEGIDGVPDLKVLNARLPLRGIDGSPAGQTLVEEQLGSADLYQFPRYWVEDAVHLPVFDGLAAQTICRALGIAQRDHRSASVEHAAQNLVDLPGAVEEAILDDGTARDEIAQTLLGEHHRLLLQRGDVDLDAARMADRVEN